ncbi:class I SAM-dependent methyltransferase [Rufibacter glacialis]|uniref:Class I SAM-dependent methyltransferase n=1 Tax=Rufibacter glacialis TaxID=1259555 RepID=A0A5M8QJK4_9BACT|nr:class I SAM-dependent methyltransferase [Rufibacter glacialis]KAA6434512.1 class I SAM-dependent methyltransferase [Rufibacter glacialis]GGK70284.1 hypothetical protein GCM10011405_17930 [Rufibacter glacialis]
MNPIKDYLKTLLLKSGYTLLKGDIRKNVKENAVFSPLPNHLVSNAKVCVDRIEALKLLPKGGVAVEVGVGYGDFSKHILEIVQPEKFIGIDIFGFKEGKEPWGCQFLKETKCSHLEYYKKQLQEYIDKDIAQVKQGLSWAMLQEIPDHSVDFMYVDADHTYESVAKEIEVIKHKIKPTGIIQFNDYTLFDQNGLFPFGVPKAVHQFMIEEQYEMLYLCLHQEGFYDVVLRKWAP